MPGDTLARRSRQRFLQHRQADGFIPIEPPSRLGAGKTADFVRQRLQPRAQLFAGVHMFMHQPLVTFDEARVYTRQCFF